MKHNMNVDDARAHSSTLYFLFPLALQSSAGYDLIHEVS
jgi:hypothetical protein